jgi:hypothetical protein
MPLSELNETLIWLQMIRKSELLKAALLSEIIDENHYLCRIFIASIKQHAPDHRRSKMENGKKKIRKGVSMFFVPSHAASPKGHK